ncbi:Type I restriction-modification system, specificity subunit S [Fructilactobacillus florum 8D]|uniref:Type I restriction-modification system, specificity subunit S n=1 Tax=Fructilactobacillus florum 8D TaxID=1221538 RepID=W9EDF0_9LACO|nr:restriction endonuclease subunit S [Fructilactobacillus florum]ETO40102.1 Type I restriction-modification system, specificity subunit S [Fructilactobacillus florum 8D]
MKNDKMTPKIRFKGFLEPWEQRKFEDVFNYERPDKYIVKNTDYLIKGTPVLTANKSFVLGYSNEKNVYDKGPSIIFDDFTLESHYVDFSYLVKSSAIKILTPKNNNDIYYLYELLNNANIRPIGHNRHYISVVQRKSTSMSTDVQEQRLISNILKKNKKSIAANERKLSQLKSLKKLFMQRIFIQNWRFKGFTDPWEQRKLGDVFSYSSSKLIANKISNMGNGQYPVFDATALIGNIETYDMTNKYISIIKDGSGVGSIKLRPEKSSVISTMGYLSTKNNSIYFLYYLLSQINLSKYIVGSTIPHIYFSDYKNGKIFVPKSIEQNKIGFFIKYFDESLAANERKLENLKKVKKYLMQNLFV